MVGMTLVEGKSRCRLDNQCVNDFSAHRRRGDVESISDRTLPSILEIERKEWRKYFSLASFVSVTKVTFKIKLVLKVVLLVCTTSKG